MKRIRVFLVEDAAVVRSLLVQILEEDAVIDVVGVAADGAEGLRRLEHVAADVLVLDLEMPGMSGLEMLQEMKTQGISLPVIVFSSVTERGAMSTIAALQLGASDYVTKPTMVGSAAVAREYIRGSLLTRIHALAHRVRSPEAVPVAPSVMVAKSASRAPAARIDAVVIGISVGGPNALSELLPLLPENLPVPVFIVQHMPALFTRALAERLAGRARMPVYECSEAVPVRAGRVWLAAGGYHLVLKRENGEVWVGPDLAAPVNYCRPAVDVLFRDAAKIYGAGVLGVVMTGMGNDGLDGSRELHAAGARIIVQDEASCVVWGMPGSVYRAGLADAVLPLSELAGEIVARVGLGRSWTPSSADAAVQSDVHVGAGKVASTGATLQGDVAP